MLVSTGIGQTRINGLQLQFSKDDYNSWNWLGNYNYFAENNSGIGIRITDAFRSNLFNRETYNRQWQDENNWDSYLYYRKNGYIYGCYFGSWYLSDQELGDQWKRSNNAFGIKSNVVLNTKTVVRPHLGFQRAEDRRIIDYGWDFGIDGKMVDFNIGDYSTSLYAQTDYDLFTNRHNSLNEINADIYALFSGYTRDWLEIAFLDDRKQYYGLSKNLVDLSRNKMSLDNHFFYKISPKTDINVWTSLSEEVLNEDESNKRKITNFTNQLNYGLYANPLTMIVGLKTEQESRDNTELTTDSKARSTSFTSLFVYNLGLNDQLRCELSYGKKQYDTPDSLINHNDRDEQRYIGILRYFHKVSPVLSWQTETYFYLFHQIFLFKEMSANNNWNRILRLSTSVSYRNKEFKNTLQTGVLANYTVYDYQQLLVNKESYVFRQYDISDSLYFPLNRTLFVCFFGRLELIDRGIFYADQFAQMVTHDIRNVYCNLFIRKKYGRWFDYDIGVVLDQRHEWRHLTEKQKVRNNIRYSPFLKLFYPLEKHVRFMASIYYTTLRDIGRLQTTYAKGQMNLEYYF